MKFTSIQVENISTHEVSYILLFFSSCIWLYFLQNFFEVLIAVKSISLAL